MEQFFPEGRRLIVFKVIFGSLFIILVTFLGYRQLIQSEKYKEQERKQGQRRIVRPGPRGDVFDRNGNLLIGNKAHFSAKLHLESIEDEIWKKRKVLRDKSVSLQTVLKKENQLSIEKLLSFGFNESVIKSRFIRLSGRSKKYDGQILRVKVFFQGQRIPVEQKESWFCHLPNHNPNRKISLIVEDSEKEININLANLFSVKFTTDSSGLLMPVTPWNQNSQQSLIPFIEPPPQSWEKIFSTSASSLLWEARFQVVQSYSNQINEIIGRSDNVEMNDLIRHWREKILFPIEIASNLQPKEYACLVEKITPNSPIEVQAEAIRHYPYNSLASHVLGYVGSGYEPDTKDLFGNDLTTYEIMGRKGKAGIEKIFDQQLRGVDGGEIWRVNPDGTRYEQIEKKISRKGESIILSLDAELQEIAESSISAMIEKVASLRRLPDLDWRKTILRRTNQALSGSNEKKVTANLLLSAFVDAPYPLDGSQASTVAGFQGTVKDADQLLEELYARGVLSKPDLTINRYELAPPPLPPGAAVLIELKTGQILAIASKPNYNLSQLTPFISQKVYNQIQRREAWLPRAWHPGYAPASPVKLVTAFAALKEGVLEANATGNCEGIHRGMECHVFPGKHGEMNLEDAISQSCNVYFYRLGEKIGFQKLIDAAKFMGLDHNPSIEVPTLRDRPIVPDPEWKKKRLGVRWTLEDTFNIAIGQGGLRQSPLQMASMVARIATNRQHFTPTLMNSKDSILEHSPTLGLKEDHLQKIIAGMQKATERGTARRCKIHGISVAGKTGTGQWRNHNMNLNLAWFVGFAPVENPEVAIATLVEGVIPQDQVQGGLTATPIARDLLQAYFDKKNNKLALGNN
jgi:cell division protein FtsI/penicillin-binding protein 2